MGAPAAEQKGNEKPFTFDTVAVLCSVILTNGGKIGIGAYDQMSALDGKRTANSFQHEFRAVLKRARELSESSKDTKPKPVIATPKTPKSSPGKNKTGSGSGKKRSKKTSLLLKASFH